MRARDCTVFPRSAVEDDETSGGRDFEENEELGENEEDFDPEDDEEPDLYSEYDALRDKSL